MTKTSARAIADRYFKMQCERLGPLDHKLYNQAADIAVNEMLREAGVMPAKAKRSMKANRAFIKAHEAHHASAAMRAVHPRELAHERMGALVDPVKLAKDTEDGLAIEAAIAREDDKQRVGRTRDVWVKPRSLEDIYAVLKGEK